MTQLPSSLPSSLYPAALSQPGSVSTFSPGPRASTISPGGDWAPGKVLPASCLPGTFPSQEVAPSFSLGEFESSSISCRRSLSSHETAFKLKREMWQEQKTQREHLRQSTNRQEPAAQAPEALPATEPLGARHPHHMLHEHKTQISFWVSCSDPRRVEVCSRVKLSL